VIALAGHVTVAVVVRLPKHVLCAGAMVIVGETVGRRSSVGEGEGDRRSDDARSVKQGKNKCRSRAQFLRQRRQHEWILDPHCVR
jgi:hypothetical protein